MVRHYFPQSPSGEVATNTNFPPQSGGENTSSPVSGTMEYEDFVGMEYEDFVDMDYESTIPPIPPLPPIPADWFDTDWKKRFPLTIQTGKVLPLAGQANFQMVVDSTFPELQGQTQNQLRFAVGGGTSPPPQLKYEIEEFDGITGRLVAWVEIPLIEDGDVLNVYYNNSLAPPDDSNGPDVWNLGNNNIVTWHLNQKTFGANSTLDSTGDSANNFTPDSGMTPSSNAVDGKPDGAVRFDGVDDRMIGTGSTTLRSITNGFTFMAWAKIDNFSDERLMFSLFVTGGIGFRISSSTSLSFTTFGVLDYVKTGVPTISTTEFTHFAVRFGATEPDLNDATFFVNGVQIGTKIDGALPAKPAGGDYIIGGPPGLFEWDGDLGEMRVYSSELSNDLIKTIFNNEDDAGEPGVPGFYAVGPVTPIL